jgi:chemotaxis protein MotB
MTKPEIRMGFTETRDIHSCFVIRASLDIRHSTLVIVEEHRLNRDLIAEKNDLHLKANAMAGKGGGAWKVAYADFVTAMMAFFLVMWITAQSNAMKQAVAKYFEHPYEASSRSPIPSKSSSGSSLVPLSRGMDGSAPHATNKGKSARGGGMITDDATPIDPANVPKTGGLRKRSGMLLRNSDDTGMGAVIEFTDNSTALDRAAKQTLDELIPRFLGKLNKVEIRGHTAAETPTALKTENSPVNDQDMWQLAYSRCLATMKYLEAHGIDKKRIRLSQAGIYEPAADEDAASEEQNSRVEVYLLTEFADDYLTTAKFDVKQQGPALPGEPDAAKPSTSRESNH